MNQIKNIPDFVFACLNESATAQEIEQLDQWLVDLENAQLYKQLKTINMLSNDLKLYRSFNIETARKKVELEIKERKRIVFFHRLQRYAAVLLVPVLLTAAFFIYKTIHLKQDISRSIVVQNIYAQPGTRSHFFLPDSTEVWLNTASSIKFPSIFKGKTRLVELDGEAYFKVYKDEKKPFIVQKDGFRVRALGTAFNFCAYDGDRRFSATLEEGKIQVTEISLNKTLLINPGEQVDFLVSENKFKKSKVNVQNVIAWKNGRLVFDKTPLSDVVLALGRWFNADIELVDPSIANYRYTATFTNESLKQVMELLELSAPIKYTIKERSKTDDNSFTKELVRIRKSSNIEFIKQN
ncbi:FecR family protein [Sunxiuqinia indica]|uniref:FecR family protein n=1 Tax=Sunxiuqinia indica TaxID=2692584 RepID=UPI0013588B89|nr:FecR domain-containing protein [Sunxiuqinia indica]